MLFSSDVMCHQAVLDSSQIKGCENEEFTHSVVAVIIARAVAIEAAAAQFNLAFIPLNWAFYWFVMPAAHK